MGYTLDICEITLHQQNNLNKMGIIVWIPENDGLFLTYLSIVSLLPLNRNNVGDTNDNYVKN